MIYVVLALVLLLIVLVLAHSRERDQARKSLEAREQKWTDERLQLVSAVKSPTYLPTHTTNTRDPYVPPDALDYQGIGSVSLNEPSDN